MMHQTGVCFKVDNFVDVDGCAEECEEVEFGGAGGFSASWEVGNRGMLVCIYCTVHLRVGSLDKYSSKKVDSEVICHRYNLSRH